MVRSVVRMPLIGPNPLDPSNEEWRNELLSQQDGVVHRRDLSPEDLRIVKRAVVGKRWQRINRDVFVSHNGPLTDEQRMWAYLLACPREAALSGLTAVALDGLRGFEPDKVHITVPCGTSGIHRDDVEIHYSRFLGRQHVHPVREPRRTRPPRSVLDAASWADSDARARAIILAGVQQRLVTPQQLEELLPARGPCLRHALIEESVDDAKGGIASLPEHEFNLIVRGFHLPPPTRQAVLRRANGCYYLDVDWKEFLMSAEVDGLHHMNVLQWDADLDRANEISIDNRTVFRFTSYAVRHKQMRVGSVLVRALMARGWTGP